MNHAVFVIAEAGVNHNGERDLAFALVEAAAAAGADAVKFQTFNARRLAASRAPKAAYQKRTTDESESQLAMLQKLELPLSWHAPLQAHARALGIEFLSTAFDAESLEFLETLQLPLYKIPSGELTNGPLLWRFARTGKALILSTGMSTLGEIEQALVVLAHGMQHDTPPASLSAAWQWWSQPASRGLVQQRVSLLHCTSQYPAPMSEINLSAMDTLRGAFHLPVGYSDHTQGNLIPIAAVARGASIIEKHFTTDRRLPGPDHAASLEPLELKQMVSDIRQLQAALGDGTKCPQASEWDTRTAARQNVVAARAIAAGSVLTASDLTTARAGQGRLAMQYWDSIGESLALSLEAGDPLP